MSVDNRMKYLQAVKCMISAPPKYKKYFPVVESRYDDFAALHANASFGGIVPLFPAIS